MTRYRVQSRRSWPAGRRSLTGTHALIVSAPDADAARAVFAGVCGWEAGTLTVEVVQ